MYLNKQPRTDRQRAVQTHPTDYYHHRIAELGLSEREAQAAGIWPDPDTGNTKIYLRDFSGAWVNVAHHRTGKVHPFTVTRHHPDQVGKKYFRLNAATLEPEEATVPKYSSEPGKKPQAYPSPAAIAANNNNLQGGPLAVIEGYFKALALSRAGMETVAFCGLSLYNLKDNPGLRKHITRRRPDSLPITYDGDALEVRRDKNHGYFTSGRRENFCNSACRFAGELFRHLDTIGHHATVRFSMVNPDHPHKGADDLLAAVEDPLNVAKELAEGINGNYWLSFPLKPDSYEKQIRSFFNLDSPANFYRENAEAIGNEPFIWNGYTFQQTEGGLIMPNDHFAVSVKTDHLQVTDWMSEQSEAIEALIKKHPRIAISGPTGVGKTSETIRIAKRLNLRLLLTVPLKAIAGQQGTNPDVYVLHGNVSPEMAAVANASPIVVCTYDTAHHITDVSDRLMAIDEVHDLVNQQGFRSSAIRKVFEMAERAKQVLYLSGTMPKALLKAYSVPLVSITRTKSPDVRLHRLNAATSSLKAMTEALLSQLTGDLKENNGLVNITLFNSKEKAELVRQSLLTAGLVTTDEIVVLSRDHIEAGERAAYDDLVNHGIIRPGVRVVLTTSIISEGVNINNTNVGRVYSVGVTCPDTVRQFTARFRKMDRLDLFLIAQPNDVPGWDFKTRTADRIEHEIKVATLAAQIQTLQKLEFGDNTPDFYKSEFQPCIKPTESGEGYEVDVPAILAKEHRRKIDNAPPAYLIGRLLEYGGFNLYVEAAAKKYEDSVAILDALTKEGKEIKEIFMANLRAELAADPAVAIGALFHYYRRKGDRHGAGKIKHLAGDLLSFDLDAAALAWINENPAALTDQDVCELIRRAAQLHFAGVEETAPWLKGKGRSWKIVWRQTKTVFGLKIIDTRKARELPHLLRYDLKAKQAVIQRVEDNLASGRHTLGDVELSEILRAVLIEADGRSGTAKAMCLIDLTPRRAVNLIRELFDVEATRQGRRTRLTIKSLIDKVPASEHLSAKCTRLKADPALIKGLSR